MDTKDIFSAGRNIKCFDKIKIAHNSTGWRLHANNKYYRDGSFNEVVSCHKARNDTDWFIVSTVDKELHHANHNLRNGDEIVLTHMISKKNVHTSTAYESPISKNPEVSLCLSSGANGCLEDIWKLELFYSQDEYWRVGDLFRLVNRQAKNHFLYCHKKKMDEYAGDFQVCSVPLQVKSPAKQGQQQPEETNEKDDDKDKKDLNPKFRQWLVCQIDPYIFTAPISSNPKVKAKAQSEEFQRLKQIKKNRDSTKKKVTKNQPNPTTDLIRFYDETFAKRKAPPKRSCWKKYICCCCFPQEDPDEYYENLAS